MRNKIYADKNDKPALYILHTQRPRYLAQVTQETSDFVEDGDNCWKLIYNGSIFKIEIAQNYDEQSEKAINGKKLTAFLKTLLMHKSL